MTLPNNQTLSSGISSLVDIANRIAAIQMTISVAGMDRPNVVLAEPFQPSTTSRTLCPFFINELRRGISDVGAGSTAPMAGTGQIARDSEFGMVLCVEGRDGNIDLKFGIWDTALWVDAVYVMFAKHIKLSNPVGGAIDLPTVVDAKIKAWQLTNYQYGDMEYLAIDFKLAVRERISTLLAA